MCGVTASDPSVTEPATEDVVEDVQDDPEVEGEPTAASGSTRVLSPGTQVEVRDRFLGAWQRGFSVDELHPTGTYTVRRTSDATLLPGEFSRDEIRRERRKRSNWWY